MANEAGISDRKLLETAVGSAIKRTKYEWVKIALLFLHATSKLFQFTILNLSG